MQPEDNFHTIKVAIRSAPLWFIVFVSACAPVPAHVTAPQARFPADPVLAFVSGGRIGQTASVIELSGAGIVSVVIETQYNSAGGQVCRTYATANATGQVQQLACGDGANWRVVPRLINSSN